MPGGRAGSPQAEHVAPRRLVLPGPNPVRPRLPRRPGCDLRSLSPVRSLQHVRAGAASGGPARSRLAHVAAVHDRPPLRYNARMVADQAHTGPALARLSGVMAGIVAWSAVAAVDTRVGVSSCSRFAKGIGMARERLNQQRFQANALGIDQIRRNLRVLATFRTGTPGSSNLTIRQGIFTKTSGKINIFKGIVRDDHDSLTNPSVTNEILANLSRLAHHYLDHPTDDDWDILCNAMYGFLKLGSKYRARGTVDNIVQAMSTVCGQAQQLFHGRLDRFRLEKAAAYSQGVYNNANKVHLGGTCWAMVMDWARRFVLKKKMGYAHDPKYQSLPYVEKKLLHRGKYIAHVFGLPQGRTFADVGTAIKAIAPGNKAQTNDLLQQYYAEQKGSKKTVEEKFRGLSYSVGDYLGLGVIHIGNQERINCTVTLIAHVNRWIEQSEAAHRRNQFSLFVHEIGFWMREEIGYQNWAVHRTRTASQGDALGLGQLGPTPPRIINQGGGHSLGFAYDPTGKKCYFMDPNYGEWVLPNDAVRVASLIYDVLKTYSAGSECGFSNPLNICRSIFQAQHSLFTSNSP